MIATGVIRKIDRLNRITLPQEICRLRKLTAGSLLHISVSGKTILLNPFYESCFFCGSDIDLTLHEGYSICGHCIAVLKDPRARLLQAIEAPLLLGNHD